ncbi:MAG: hypothetical protein ABR949_10300 [Candidatus Aquilonibacter sp.]
MKIGLRSNQGNLRIATFRIYSASEFQMSVDRLDPKEGIQFSIPVARLNTDECIWMRPSVEDFARQIVACDQS